MGQCRWIHIWWNLLAGSPKIVYGLKVKSEADAILLSKKNYVSFFYVRKTSDLLFSLQQ